MFHISCTHINVCYKHIQIKQIIYWTFLLHSFAAKTESELSCKNKVLRRRVLASFTAILLCFCPPGNSKSFRWNCVQPFRCELPGWCQREFQRAAPAQWCCSLTNRSQEVLWSTPWPSVAETCWKLNGMPNHLIPWLYYYTKNLDCTSRYSKIQ